MLCGEGVSLLASMTAAVGVSGGDRLRISCASHRERERNTDGKGREGRKGCRSGDQITLTNARVSSSGAWAKPR